MYDTSKKNRYLAAAVCALLLLTVMIVFGQTAQFDFVNFDDDAYVYDNPHVSQGLTKDTVAWSFTAVHSNNWHPLTWLSHALDCQLYGTQHTGGHHFTNVMLHAAVAILLFLVFWQMTGNLWASAFVAALFAVHPLRAESVAWVSERKDLLSGLFFMLTLGAYLSYVRHPFSRVRYLLVAVLFVLGLMAKPMLVTLPFVLLLLDYWPLGRTSDQQGDCPNYRDNENGTVPFDGGPQTWRPLIAEKIPLIALGAVSCIITILAQGQAIAVTESLPISSRIANALVAYVTYIGQFFYPAGLAAFYPHPENGLPIWKIAGALLLLGGISAGAWIERKRFPFLLVGWLWYLVMLVPVSGLIQVGDQSMADRYTYLPGIGLCLALTWGIAQLSLAWPLRRWVCGAASALVLAILAGATIVQTAYWHDSETLWNRALACTTHNAFAQYNLGVTLSERGDDGEAMKCFQEAVAIQPRAADAQNNLGVLLAKSGQLDRAMEHFQAALDARPNLAEADNNLGKAFEQRKNIPEAMSYYEAALKSRPDLADAHRNLGRLLERQGKIDEAILHWREAVMLQPSDLDALNQLAWAMATRPEASIRNGPNAVELARWAVRLSRGRSPVPLGTLAAAYAEDGKYADAVKTADLAIAIAARQGDAATAAALRKQSQCYRSGAPYHQAP
jgi:protein O-mannosyl-transferase